MMACIIIVPKLALPLARTLIGHIFEKLQKWGNNIFDQSNYKSVTKYLSL